MPAEPSMSTRPLKVLSLFGTRPEAIKMAPLVSRLGQDPRFDSTVVVSAQHRSMLDQVLELFDVVPDMDLDVMAPGQSPIHVLVKVLDKMSSILDQVRPDWVLVQGDTTTAMAGAVAATYADVRVGHVEAGLRTFDRRQPFPEEINRLVAGVCADLHFAPTQTSRDNLLRESKDPSSVMVTGNTVIDALHQVVKMPAPQVEALEEVSPDKDLVLVTAHRRENFGEPFAQICAAIATLASQRRDSTEFVYPVHPNPNVAQVAHERLGNLPNVHLCEPLEYHELVTVMNRSKIVITDSGGIQEEAPSLGKPVLVLRNVTERPEAVEAGTVRLVGCNTELIIHEATKLLDNEAAFAEMARAVNPYGDGHAVDRIMEALAGNPVEPFDPAT